jgi:crossover junction endodeoxyribonuclease RuvC
MSKNLVSIGVDPGQTGGFGFVPHDPEIPAWACKMPATDEDLLDMLRKVQEDWLCHATLEQVHAMPKQGVSSSFTFGEGYGKLQMVLQCLKVPYSKVTPQKWQKHMQCLTKGDKNVSKARAQQLFPHLKITHATADALLIAEFGQRNYSKTASAK